MRDIKENEVIPSQKNRTILQLPILGELDGDNWLLVTSNHKTYRITAGVFSSLLSGLVVNRVTLGLDKVDNTSDLDKPLSTASIEALLEKADKDHIHEVTDINGLKAFIDNIVEDTLELRSYVRTEILNLYMRDKVDKSDFNTIIEDIRSTPGEKGDIGPQGPIGPSGRSSYEIWKEQQGNEGKTIEDYFSSLHGLDGKSAYEIAVDNGFQGTPNEWLASLQAQVRISSEPSNRLERKPDGFYVSNTLEPDPLPFYIFSKG